MNESREATRQHVDTKIASGSKQLVTFNCCFKNKVKKLYTSVVYPNTQGKEYRRPRNEKKTERNQDNATTTMNQHQPEPLPRREIYFTQRAPSPRAATPTSAALQAAPS